MSGGSMREYWDERAREDPFYFVDNRLRYGDPDSERFWQGGSEAVDLMLSELRQQFEQTDDVVEIGCGLGRLTRVIAPVTASVRALDVSAEMLKRARGLNPGLGNVTWIQGNGSSLAGIDDASADACFSDVVFQHIPDPQITLGYVREIGRILRSGGWAAFQISNQPAIHRGPEGLERFLGRLRALVGRGPRGQTHPAWLGSAIELGDLERAAADGGMEVERVTNAGTQYCRVLLRRR